MASCSPRRRSPRSRRPRPTRRRMASSRANVRAIAVPRTPSMSAPSKGWAGSISRPSSIPTPKSPLPSSMTARPRSPPLKSSMIGWCIRLSRMLTDRGTEFCGGQSHEYELYLAVEDVDHSRTKTKSPQTNGICERFHRTVLDEFYRVAFRKKIYLAIDELQADLDVWLVEYNEQRPHQGRWCFGKTPMQTFLDALPIAMEKLMAA